MSKMIALFFIRIALILAVLFLLGHLVGLRESTAIISGTRPATELELFLGAFYALSWFGFVLLSPILALAGGMQLVMGWLFSRVNGRDHAAESGSRRQRGEPKARLQTSHSA